MSNDESTTPMRAGVVIDPPQVFACVLEGASSEPYSYCPYEYVGSNIEIFEIVSQLLNWNVTYASSDRYGCAGCENTFSGGGLAGAVQRGEVDVTASLMGLHPSFLDFLHYSYPITNLQFGLLAHPPQPRDISLLIIKPFHSSIWIVVAVFLLFATVGARLSRKLQCFDFSRLLEQGLLAWLAFFIGAAYTSLIRASLLRPQAELPFRNIDELLEHTLRHRGSYVVLTEDDYWSANAAADWIGAGRVGQLGRMARERGYTIYERDVDKLLTMFASDRRYVLWGEISRIYRGMVEIPGSRAIFDHQFSSYWLAFAFPPNSTWISKMNEITPFLFEFADRTIRSYAYEYAMDRVTTVSKAASQNEDESAGVALSLTVLQGAFVVLLVGSGVSLSVLGLERRFHKSCTQRRKVTPSSRITKQTAVTHQA